MFAMTRILVTGSSGLIGSALCAALTRAGLTVRPFDIRNRPDDDVRNAQRLAAACDGVDGVVHLAAVSRVVWAHQNPALCRAVNEGGFDNLAAALRTCSARPWLLFASSREVYGQQDDLPVTEDAVRLPCNVYARSKVHGEDATLALRDDGFVTAIARFSNVYGAVDDHADRVAPAFARTAAAGGVLRVDGERNMLDFTHVDDVIRGVLSLIDEVRAGEQLHPIHFTTGRGVTLGELARLAQKEAMQPLTVQPHEPRDYDVSRFCGAPDRARDLLGWKSQISIEDGFAALTQAFAQQKASA